MRRNLSGSVVGRWRVIALAPSRFTASGAAKGYWHCECSCGTLAEVQSQHLLTRRTLSCGCLKRELAAAKNTTHGGRHSPEYEVWTQMLQRCENPRNKAFSSYGARGIKVCERWHDFENFCDDMGPRPEGLSIERKNNDGDYTPTNCHWATNFEQARNKRKTLYLCHLGERISLAELAERNGLKYMTLYNRVVLRSEPIDQALRPAAKTGRWAT